jgi:hypothetical protein
VSTSSRRQAGGALFWLSAAAGWAVIAYGVRGAFQHHIDTNPRDLAWFFFGGALVHDLVFAPLLLLGGVLVARAVPARARAIVQAALIVSGTVALFAYPAVRGYGRAVHNPSALPHNYAAGLLLILAAIWVVAATVGVISLRRTSTSSPDRAGQ